MVLILKKNSLIIFYSLFLFFLVSCNIKNKDKETTSQDSIQENKKSTALNFYFSPDNPVIINDKISTESVISGKTFIACTSKKELKLKWEKILMKAPESWNIYFCDNISCHFEFPDSCNLLPINASDSLKSNPMILYLEHNDTKGEGEVKLKVFEVGNEKNADTIIYKISIK